MFLTYWLSPTRSYLWIVTPARVQLITLPQSSEIEVLVRDYQQMIDTVIADPLKTSGAGDRLFQVLVAPALKSIPSGGRVVIVPDGALYALNFETLPVAAARRAGVTTGSRTSNCSSRPRWRCSRAGRHGSPIRRRRRYS